VALIDEIFDGLLERRSFDVMDEVAFVLREIVIESL